MSQINTLYIITERGRREAMEKQRETFDFDKKDVSMISFKTYNSNITEAYSLA